MRLIVIFEDTPQMEDIRLRLQDEHFKFLEKHRNEIIAAGGLMQIEKTGFVGGMWIFSGSSVERAIELINLDPYSEGSRPYRLLNWGKALPQYSCEI